MGACENAMNMHRVTDTMSYRVFALLFLAAVISASTGADDLVAETVESEIAEVADVNLVQLNSDAKTEVDSMLKSGKSITECRSVADGCIKGVTTQITALQTSLNNLPTGNSCGGIEDKIIIKAKETLNEANVKYNIAYQAYISASSTRLEFRSITIGSIKMGDCSAFFGDKGFIAIKHRYDAAFRVYVQAKGALKVAQKGWEMAIIEQKKAIRDCACNTINRLDTTWSASLTAYAKSTTQWKKCHLMECAIAGTSMSSCRIPGKPKLSKPGLKITFNGEVLTSSVCHGHNAHKKWPALKVAKPKPVKGKLSVYIQTGNVPGAESSGKAPMFHFRGDTGKWFNRRLTPLKRGKAGTYHLTPPRDLGNILSVTLTSASTDGWLITGLSVKSGGRSWKGFGCIPQWLDSKPYNSPSVYLCPGQGSCSSKKNKWGNNCNTWVNAKPDRCNAANYQKNCAKKCCEMHGKPKARVSLDGKYYKKACAVEPNGQMWGLRFKIQGDCSRKNQCTFSYPDNRGPACYGYLIKKGTPTCSGHTCYYSFTEHYIRSTGCVTGGWIKLKAQAGQHNMPWIWYKGPTSRNYQQTSYTCTVPRTTGKFLPPIDHCPHHDKFTLTAGARQC